VSFVKGVVYPVKNRGKVKKIGGIFVKGVVCPVKNRGEILIYNLIKTPPPYYRAYNSSCSQVILVYLHPFRRNSLFCSQKSPKNYFDIFRVQDHSRSSILTFLRSSSSVLVMISSMSVPICNHLHTRQANTR